ncbi:MAG: hypothetical protein MJK04_03465, partial [Psychrosphaera sp.]|nr:hypothetical protein [Psychrosphaera sp.]
MFKAKKRLHKDKKQLAFAPSSMSVFKSRLVKAILAVLVAAVVLLAAFFTIDETLHPDIADIVKKYNHQHTLLDNGSVYQLGMWAAKGESPYTVGLHRIKQYQAALKAANNAVDNLTFADYPNTNRIKELYPTEQQPPLLCDFLKLSCLEYIYEHSDDTAMLLNVNTDFIQRYDELMGFERFELFAAPSKFQPEFWFGPSQDVAKLKLMNIIGSYKLSITGQSSGGELVMDELVQLIAFHQKVFEQTPYVTPKIVSVLEFDLILEVTGFLIAKTRAPERALWAGVIKALVGL